MADYSEKVKLLIDSLIERIDDFAGDYPQIIFPSRFLPAIKDFRDSISDNIILKNCRRINGDIHYLYPLKEPLRPQEPCLESVPSTYQSYKGEIRYYIDSYYKGNQRHYYNLDIRTILLDIFISFVFGAGFGVFLVSIFGILWDITPWSDDSLSFQVISGVMFIAPMVIIFIVRILDESIKVPVFEETPYTEQQLAYKRDKAQREYEEALEKYPAKLNLYTEQLETYNHDMKEQESIVLDSIPIIIADTLKSFFQESLDYFVVDEGPQRGRSENKLFAMLMQTIPSAVHIDTCVSGYFPDIVVSTTNKVHIDIEIDEPYEMATKKEIHYKGCSDEERNKRLCEDNWVVLRFSEKQIMTNCDGCVQLIRDLISFIETGKLTRANRITEVRSQMTDKQWTKEEARLMAINDYRNTY